MEPLTCFYRVAPLSLPRRWCWPLVLDGLSCSAPLPLLPWQPDANLLSCQTEATSTHTVPGRAGQAKNAGCAPWIELPHLHIDLLNLMNWIFFFFLFFFTKYTLFILTIFSFCCFLKLIFIGIELLYNVVLVSTVQQSEPALSSVQFTCSVVSDSLRPHGLQHTRLPCPSQTAPGVCSNSCPLSWWCHPGISSSVAPFSCHQSFPASGSFPMSQLFASGGQSIGASALTSVLPMNIQDWSPLGWTGWISLQSKGCSAVFSNATVQKHQFFGVQLSL